MKAPAERKRVGLQFFYRGLLKRQYSAGGDSLTAAVAVAQRELSTMQKTPESEDNVFSIFYGFPVELISRWCRVSPATAYKYKRGLIKPSKQAARLFFLHAQGQVLGPEWRGWSIRGDKLILPDNTELTPNQLQAYTFVYQLASVHAPEEVRNLFQRMQA